jgi:hypothetical protein
METYTCMGLISFLLWTDERQACWKGREQREGEDDMIDLLTVHT